MEYELMNLNSPLYDLTVRNPVGQEATAVLENLTEDYKIDNLRPILDEMKGIGVKNIVLDLSKFSATSRSQWLAFLDGAVSIASGFKTRFTGIAVDEASAGEPSYKKYITPKIAKNLDDAVESLSK